ncbi:MAG: hypothetical protein RBG13Loki_4233 [Promethearchaeota archaeon CR_4]|nr:MAG: hypothetical protein RBG13Loki_4233 [Candidatus Lokiarchaeota archaeon CR_4]
MGELPKNQQRIFLFLLDHFKTKESFTKEELLSNAIEWSKSTPDTYFTKIYSPLLVDLEDAKYRVGEIFAKYTSEAKFQKYISQKRNTRAKYSKLSYSNVIVFEFFMPLAHETTLRQSLDALFYKDTIIPRLKNIIGEFELKKYFPRSETEEDDQYYERVCNWISERFVGYSINHVSGRFRAEEIKTMTEAVEMQKIWDSYLLDETTAIVKFIFPVGNPVKNTIPNLLNYFPMTQQETEKKGLDQLNQEANRIRWLFDALFVKTIVELVGEDQIWMVETGMQNRLHIWRAIE